MLMLMLVEIKSSLFLFAPLLSQTLSRPLSSSIPPHPFRGLTNPLQPDPNLLLTYFTHPPTPHSLSLFKLLFQSNIPSFNSLLRQLSQAELFQVIINLYNLLRLSNAKPDHFTFPYVLKACSAVLPFNTCTSLHSHIIKTGFMDNVFVANSVLLFYSNYGLLESAQTIFDTMPVRNLVSWNTMISGCVVNGFPHAALELCSSMKFHGMRLDKVGLKIVIPACSQVGELSLGRSTHAHIIVSGWSSDTVLITVVMDMYAKCNDLDVARRLFDEIPRKDVVSWNAMISGYLQSGRLEVVLDLFHKMQIENIRPSVVTVLITCQACADLANLRRGETVHGYITKLGLGFDSSVGVLLMNMYSKCGELNLAIQLFRGLETEDVNSWTAMIQALGMHGYGKAAHMGFFKMLKGGVDPDGLCFLIVLSCCSHNGLLKEGINFFHFMIRNFGIVPEMKHYVTMVDLMGRVGLVDEAFRFIGQMPVEPSSDVWRAFLNACRTHDSPKLGNCLENS